MFLFFLFFFKEKSKYSFIVSTGMFLLFRVSILRKHCYLVYKSLCHAILESLPKFLLVDPCTLSVFFSMVLAKFWQIPSLRGLGYFPWHVCGIWWDLVWFCDEVLLWLDPRILWAWGWPPCTAWWRLSCSLCMMERLTRSVRVTSGFRCCHAGPLFFLRVTPPFHRHSSCRPTAAAAAAAFTSQRRGCCTIC